MKPRACFLRITKMFLAAWMKNFQKIERSVYFGLVRTWRKSDVIFTEVFKVHYGQGPAGRVCVPVLALASGHEG